MAIKNDNEADDEEQAFWNEFNKDLRRDEIKRKIKSRRERRALNREMNKYIAPIKDLLKKKKEITKDVILNYKEAKIYNFFVQNKENAFTITSFVYKFLGHEDICVLEQLEKILIEMVKDRKLKGLHYEGDYYYYLK